MQLPSFNSESMKKIKPRYIIAGLVLLLLVIGGAIGLYLVSRPQEIRQQAAGYAACAGGVTHGARACAGFRQPVICNNGAFEDLPDCTAAQYCDSGVCKLSSGGGGGATPSPTSGGACNGTSCTAPGGGCIAIHDCDSLDSNGHCTELNPQVTTSPVDAQQTANNLCKCVQVDVLNGQNNSCTNGHINGDISTLIGSSTVCPNNGCGTGGPGPTPSPTTGNPSPNPSANPSPSPRVSPTPGVSPTPSVTPTPVVSPTPGVSPTPVVSPTPGVSPSPTVTTCGGTCGSTAECPNLHTCNNGVCQLTACVNGQPCTTDMCRVNGCGDSCTSDAQCPNDHQCNAGTCKLVTCVTNSSICSQDQCRVTQCGNSCSTNADCPGNHQCNGGVCKLNECINGATCDSNQCNVVNTQPSPVPSPVLGCNDVCVNNSDCKSSNQICVDTTNGRRCRLESNITSDTCTPAGQVAAQTPSQPQQPTSLPVAGSADVLKAMAVGALAIVLGIVGFLAL